MQTTRQEARIAIVYEALMGHLTHVQNFQAFLESETAVRASYVPLTPQRTLPALAKVPGLRSAWSLRASLAAYLALRGQVDGLDAALFHTQAVSLLSAGLMRRLPSVLSSDATPLQFDRLGQAYGHTPSIHTRSGQIKQRLTQNALAKSKHVITWSQWAKDSYVNDYGLDPAKISVIPPGIETKQWTFDRPGKRAGEPVNLLFVGYDFSRKGGKTLLAALELLPPETRVRLHAVTKASDALVETPLVTYYHDVMPNSEKLRSLFALADVFVFPTHADFSPVAVIEAQASGLPVITTSVAALPEMVRHQETGLVVPVDDAVGLAGAIEMLAGDGALRARLGAAGHEAARARFEAADNYRALLQTLQNARVS